MLSRSQRTHLKVFVLLSWTKEEKSATYSTHRWCRSPHYPPRPTPQPWFEHRPQWWKTSALRTVPFETENYLTKHEVVLFLFRYHYLLQKVCCGTMVSKVSSAYNCYPLTIPNKYSGKFRFSSNKDFYCRVNFYWHCALIIFWKSVMS